MSGSTGAGSKMPLASRTLSIRQPDAAGFSVPVDLAAGRTGGLGAESRRPPDVGCAVHRRRDGRAQGTRPLCGPSGGRPAADRHTGPEPLGPGTHRRLAARVERARPVATRRHAHFEDGYLEVAVLLGTDDFTLNRAVGHIEDTALPGTDGNSGIAGHRDGFFRGLKDIAPGDAIELETLRGKEVYRVERTWVVDPEDVSVLDATPRRSLTLVTCYPFYHIVQRRNGTLSARCVSMTRPRKFSRTAEPVSCVPALVPHRLRLHLIAPDWRVAPPVR